MLRAIQYLAALLVVGFGLWIFGTSSSFQTCTTEQAAANAEQGQRNLPSLVLADVPKGAVPPSKSALAPLFDTMKARRVFKRKSSITAAPTNAEPRSPSTRNSPRSA